MKTFFLGAVPSAAHDSEALPLPEVAKLIREGTYKKKAVARLVAPEAKRLRGEGIPPSFWEE